MGARVVKYAGRLSIIIRPVILCGGAGTRLWPVSRQTFPKHLLPVTGDRSLLQQTADRLSGERFAAAIVVSGEDQRFFIKRQLESLGAPIEAILLEAVRPQHGCRSGACRLVELMQPGATTCCC